MSSPLAPTNPTPPTLPPCLAGCAKVLLLAKFRSSRPVFCHCRRAGTGWLDCLDRICLGFAPLQSPNPGPPPPPRSITFISVQYVSRTDFLGCGGKLGWPKLDEYELRESDRDSFGFIFRAGRTFKHTVEESLETCGACFSPLARQQETSTGATSKRTRYRRGLSHVLVTHVSQDSPCGFLPWLGGGGGSAAAAGGVEGGRESRGVVRSAAAVVTPLFWRHQPFAYPANFRAHGFPPSGRPSGSFEQDFREKMLSFLLHAFGM